jgi:hypothetical protein
VLGEDGGVVSGAPLLGLLVHLLAFFDRQFGEI